MKTTFLKLTAAGLMSLLGASCMTTYDAEGRPVQSVDPGAAAAIGLGAAAAGYAIGHHNRDRDYYYPYGYYGRRQYGYYGRPYRHHHRHW